MLQQILNDMYIDPELLAELDEEQKQILFCKMREEQVRRWKLRESQLEEEEEKKRVMQPKKSSGKKVTFLVGMDGEPVVVVLGDGREEVDTILEERARRQAELEADLLKRAAEEELDKLVRLSRSTVQAMEEEAARNHQNKERDPAREAVVRSLQEATVEMEKHIQAMEEADTPASKKTSSPLATPPSSTGMGLKLSSSPSTSSSSPPSPSSTSSSSGIGSLKLSSSASSSSLSSLSSNSSSASPPSPPAFSISSYVSGGYSSSPRKLNGVGMWESSAPPSSSSAPSLGKMPLGPTASLPSSKPPILSPKPTTISATLSFPAQRNSHTAASSTSSSPPSSLSSTTSTMSFSSSPLTPSPPPSLCSPRTSPPLCPLTIIEQEDLIKEGNDATTAMAVGVAAQIKRFEQLSEGSLEALKTATLERAKKRRQKEILEHLRSQVEAARQQVAEHTNGEKQNSEKDDSAWQEQERKAKEAERRIREIARRAREEHRRASAHNSSSTSPSSSPAHAINRNLNGLTHNTKNTLIKNGINGVNGVNGVNGHAGLGGGDINGNIKSVTEDFSNNNSHAKSTGGGLINTSLSKSSPLGGCVKQRLRPPKPPSRGAIVTWFREEELPRGAGLETSRLRVAPWFHGIISRTEAEEILAGSDIGRFLVRVSERIWGYAISYRAADRCRHYLIDVTGGKYTFFGSHQASHDTLGDLIEYHKKEAITASGGELLTRPCGQSNPRKPDYLELFTGTQYLAL